MDKICEQPEKSFDLFFFFLTGSDLSCDGNDPLTPVRAHFERRMSTSAQIVIQPLAIQQALTRTGTDIRCVCEVLRLSRR